MFRRQRSQQQLATAQQELRMTDAAGQNISPMEEDLAQGQLLLSLSPQYREAITLTKIIGMSNAEAAARLSISEGAVKVRVHRAISKLKQLLEAETA
jgi:RNA polymerase sigma-70 factor (ECF subfamily)